MAESPQQGADTLGTWNQYAYHLLALAALTTIGLGTLVYHWLEDWSWVDSLYFSVVAGTTVGFGDLVPTKDSSKLFTIAYIIFAVSIIGTFLNLRFRAHSMERADRYRAGHDE